MTDRLEALAHERAALSAELAQQRQAIARAARRLQPPLRRVDRLRADLRFFRQRYAYLLLPVVLLAVLNPGPTLRLLAGASTLWLAFARAQGPPEERLAHALSQLATRRP